MLTLLNVPRRTQHLVAAVLQCNHLLLWAEGSSQTRILDKLESSYHIIIEVQKKCVWQRKPKNRRINPIRVGMSRESQASRTKKKGNSSPSRKEPSSRLKSMATDTHSDSETVPRHEETGEPCCTLRSRMLNEEMRRLRSRKPVEKKRLPKRKPDEKKIVNVKNGCRHCSCR